MLSEIISASRQRDRCTKKKNLGHVWTADSLRGTGFVHALDLGVAVPRDPDVNEWFLWMGQSQMLTMTIQGNLNNLTFNYSDFSKRAG